MYKLAVQRMLQLIPLLPLSVRIKAIGNLKLGKEPTQQQISKMSQTITIKLKCDARNYPLSQT
jgi:hypothetical protein